MPIDPTGTKPQPLPAAPPALEEVSMKCRREGCDSITAFKVVIPSQPQIRMYRCVKCRHQWGINVGGHIDI